MYEYASQSDQPNRCVKCSDLMRVEEVVKLEGTDRMVKCSNEGCDRFDYWIKVH
jgi:uncharacterized Zn finger protein